MNDTDVLDVLVTDLKTGRTNGLAKTVRRAIRAMKSAGIPYCVIGATALAVRGLPRMTRDIDFVVLEDNASAAIKALRKAKFLASAPGASDDEREPMIVFVDPQTNVDVDLLIAAGEPEASAIQQSSAAKIFGATANFATLESLLLMYLYSNQPKHLGDFAAIVNSGMADLPKAESLLAEIHPEMIREWKRRLRMAISPPPAPSKPKRK